MDIPKSPDTVVNRLTDLSKLLWTGLEVGGQDVSQYFGRRARDFSRPIELNSPLAAGLVRYNALCYLRDNWQPNSGYFLEDIANNGISIRSDWCSIKVFKMLDGAPPIAHNSRASRGFYSANGNEPYLIGIDWSNPESADWKDIVPTLSRLHLIYCWEVDRRFNMTRLKLFCPRRSGNYSQGVTVFWGRSIAHPITGIKVPTVNDMSDVDDLPIYFVDAEAQGGE